MLFINIKQGLIHMLTNEEHKRIIEEQILQHLNLSDDVQSFKDRNKEESKKVMDKYTSSRHSNETKENLSTAAAVITAAVAVNVGLGLPLLAFGAIGVAAPLLYKEKKMDELKKSSDELHRFNTTSTPVEDLLLSDSFKDFKRENDKDYTNSLKQIEERQKKSNLITDLSLAGASIGGAALVLAGSLSIAPVAISIAGIFAAAKLNSNRHEKQKTLLKDSFDQNQIEEIEDIAQKYSSLYEKTMDLMLDGSSLKMDVPSSREIKVDYNDDYKPVESPKRTNSVEDELKIEGIEINNNLKEPPTSEDNLRETAKIARSIKQDEMYVVDDATRRYEAAYFLNEIREFEKRDSNSPIYDSSLPQQDRLTVEKQEFNKKLMSKFDCDVADGNISNIFYNKETGERNDDSIINEFKKGIEFEFKSLGMHMTLNNPDGQNKDGLNSVGEMLSSHKEILENSGLITHGLEVSPSAVENIKNEQRLFSELSDDITNQRETNNIKEKNENKSFYKNK